MVRKRFTPDQHWLWFRLPGSETTCPTLVDNPVAARQPGHLQIAYCLNFNAGPLTRFPLRSTVTSTVSAILTKGIPLVIP
jgi:hypothetical protein